MKHGKSSQKSAKTVQKASSKGVAAVKKGAAAIKKGVAAVKKGVAETGRQSSAASSKTRPGARGETVQASQKGDGKGVAVKAGKTGPKAEGIQVRRARAADEAARELAQAPVTFSNPDVSSAFKRALKKYPVALKRLSD